jgi:transaldolase/glucose-6-phosphate isomerase
MHTDNSVKALKFFDQSVWLDYLHRELLRSGELQRQLEQDGVCGVTSNPAIFREAIAGSDAYHEAILTLVRSGADVSGIYLGLVRDDVRATADLLKDCYERSNGRDGYVSLEVSPHLAHDYEATVEEARKLWELIDRPNLMIKVPATDEGCRALSLLIEEGINVNATLIFSPQRARQVAEAYLEGLEKRAAQNAPLDRCASVASFFISRIDSRLDPRLEQLSAVHGEKARALCGRCAILAARRAYETFLELFRHNDRFARLQKLGARPQRLLWASTGTKNPAYSDVKYIEELVARETITTVPPATLAAFRAHGRVTATLDERITTNDADKLLQTLHDLGISLETEGRALEEEGIVKFIAPYDELLARLDVERVNLLEECRRPQQLELGLYSRFAQKRLNAMEESAFGKRFWEYDATLWKAHPETHAAIRAFMGWLPIVKRMQERLPELEEFAHQVRASGFRQVVVLGMGGSSMTPLVWQRALGSAAFGLELFVLDSVDPRAIRAVEKQLRLNETLFIEASKSGTTAEPSTLSRYFYAKMEEAAGERAGEHFIAITDPGTALVQRAKDCHFRKVFLNFADIGGRYSALSCFGLAPAALMGLDIRRLFASARLIIQSCGPDIPERKNPGAALGAALGELALQGRDKLTFLLPERLKVFGLWVEQLIGESTGKEGRGILPISDETLLPAEQYGDDRVFVWYRLDDSDPQEQATAALVDGLKKLEHPIITITLADPYDLGGEFFRWEFAVATAATVLGINPFDQPDVQSSKSNTLRILAEKAAGSTKAPQSGLHLEGADAQSDPACGLELFLKRSRPRDYLALLAFIPDEPELKVALKRLALLLGVSAQLPVTTGFGPRFLHSTGQFHKGGPNTGLFVQLVSPVKPELDLAIPGQPHSFGALLQAQADGDLEALRQKGRRTLRVDLGDDPLEGLNTLLKLLEKKGTR